MPETTFDIEVIEAAGGAVLAIPAGRVVYVRGDPGECAYIIKSGQVEIRAAGRALEPISTGEIFGETALIDDAPRSSSAVALTDIVLVTIDRPIFQVLIRDDSDFALTVLRLMARRLRALSEINMAADTGPVGTLRRAG